MVLINRVLVCLHVVHGLSAATGSNCSSSSHCHVSDSAAEAAHMGAEYERLGSASQTTEPSELTTMYLYWITWPDDSDTVPVQIGLLDV